MARVMWLKWADDGEPPRPARTAYECAALFLAAGVTRPDFEIRPGSTMHSFFVYPNGLRGWLYWGDEEPLVNGPLSDDDVNAIRAELSLMIAHPHPVWVRAGVGDVATRFRFLSEAARHARVRGFDDPRVVTTRSAESASKFLVGSYPELARPVWLYYGDDRGRMVRALTDDEAELFERELRYINTYGAPAEDRVNREIQQVAAALGRLAGGEGDMSIVQKRCFEFRHSGSDKFWTIEIVESKKTCFVTYGKIGSKGSTQVKTFDSARKTAEFAVKMISEKRAKGYTEVASTKYPGAPAGQVQALIGAAVAASPPPPPAPRPTGEPEEGDRNIEI